MARKLNAITRDRRSRVAHTSERSQDTIAIHETAIRRASRGDEIVLADLYAIGARYHQGNTSLRVALNSARDSLFSMAHSSGDLHAWRKHAVHMLQSATKIEVCARELLKLRGIEHVARVAHMIADAATAAVQARSLDELDHALAAITHLDVQRSATITPAPMEDPRDSLLRGVVSDFAPVADGATGYERIAGWSPWRDVAWYAWRAAGLDRKWDAAWDCWYVLDQFPYSTIGKARGSTQKAVERNRARCRDLSPK